MTFEFTTDSSPPAPGRRPIPELLAPAGNFEALETVLEAGADSVYVGGKLFGMRQHAAWLNFDQDQMAEAIRTVHARGKRIYITLNNLLTGTELQLAASFLNYLAAERPDALIVQDWGIVRHCLESRFPVPLHASTMMNVHDPSTARFLAGLGVTRIVASRDITLERAVELQSQSGVEFEVFLHGDMCIAHGGQCLTSGILSGESSNRGKCLKPCRWKYDFVSLKGREVEVLPNPHEGDYLLARKDLSLLEQIERVAASGIAALKIEGRARKPDYLRFIVSSYRRALDDYSASSEDFDSVPRDWTEWNARRIRNLSTCYTFGDPGAETIDFSGEREPRFFSLAIEHAPLVPESFTASQGVPLPAGNPAIAVHCANYEQADAAADAGADKVRLPLSFFSDSVLGSEEENRIEALVKRCQLGVVLDRVMAPESWESLERFLFGRGSLGITEVVGNTPALALLIRGRGLRLVGDFGLNVMNTQALDFLLERGVETVTLSLEATLEQAIEISEERPGKAECVIHGPVTGMLLEHCILNAMLGGGRTPGTCRDLCRERAFGLRDPMGQIYEIHTDRECRNHLLLPRELCGLTLLPDLCAAGIASLRIEGRYSDPRTLGLTVSCYRSALDAVRQGRSIEWQQTAGFQELLSRSTRGFSLCSYGLRPREIAAAGQELPTDLWLNASQQSV